jgi:hypothetical protein
MTGGAGIAKFLSLGAGSPLVTTNTWSRASTHTLPTDPSTHPSGNGLALQLLFLRASESMGNHDSKVVDADSVD